MSDCCASTPPATRKPARRKCPVNGKEYPLVSRKTVLQHIKSPWTWQPQDMFFCDDPDCNVVYFGKDDSVISINDMRSPVGIKDKSEQAMICYCFGITRNDALRQPETKDFVVTQTRAKQCACEVRNPSGKCCLKDFPKPS